MSVITLSRPLTVRGDTLSELDLDLGKLTGKDLIDIEASLKLTGQSTGAWDMSRSFLIRVAARALGLQGEMLESLPVKDFNKIVNQVLVFFADTDSADSTQESSETSSYPSPSATPTLE